MSFWKKIELWGRRWIVIVVARLFGVPRRPITLPPSPRILVIRLDERIGNLLLLLPLLRSLRLRFPDSQIDLLGSPKGRDLIAQLEGLDQFIPFRKQALLARDGPFRTPGRLRRNRYDVVIDAANPTDPSTTQTILTRSSSAQHTIGVDRPGFGRLYTAPVLVTDPGRHEIDLRLCLLEPLPGHATTRQITLEPLPSLPPESHVVGFLDRLDGPSTLVLNVGARLAIKHLVADDYGAIAQLIQTAGFHPLISFGPAERHLAEAVCRRSPTSALAPPTNLIELAAVYARVRAVITCDTGPMHLAVAVGTPTCGIFLTTDPVRYGHPDRPHLCLDARTRSLPELWPELRRWLESLS